MTPRKKPLYVSSAALAERIGVVPGAVTNAVERGTLIPDAWVDTPQNRTPLFSQATADAITEAGHLPRKVRR